MWSEFICLSIVSNGELYEHSYKRLTSSKDSEFFDLLSDYHISMVGLRCMELVTFIRVSALRCTH
jgi:hypothetical protein